MSDLSKSLANIHRIIKTGGTLQILEFAPKPLRFEKFYESYRKNYLPFVGKLFFQDDSSYEYLSHSIETFKTPEEVEILLKNAGFKNIIVTPYTQGIVYLYKAVA
jgi:demethylmenaquinone methyltransferase/2-methoxy-6-polyprenyl-1,4-benzoquinol methylase